MLARPTLAFVWVFALGAGLLQALAAENQKPADLSAELQAAKAKLVGQQEFELRYRFAPGESLRWKVTHLATTETTIKGNTSTAKMRSLSTKLWRVQGIDQDGNITFTNSVESVDMWQQVADRPEVRYNSEKDTEAPPEYQPVARTVRQPLASVTIRPNGEVVRREGQSANYDFGMGEIVVSFPENPVRAGSQWQAPSEVLVRLPDGHVRRIKIRKLYTLEKVQTGVATIAVKTEVLTPINDPQVKVQLAQKLTNGVIKFDIDAGRLLSQQIDWDETVVGFNEADSMMKYLARFTEELVPPSAGAQASLPASKPTSAR